MKLKHAECFSLLVLEGRVITKLYFLCNVRVDYDAVSVSCSYVSVTWPLGR